MKKIILPMILLFTGVGSGVGAGLYLMPKTEISDLDMACTCDDLGSETLPTNQIQDVVNNESEEGQNKEYAKLANQFVVPLVTDGKVSGLVVMSISLEVPEGGIEAAFALEPRLRDSFLQVMFEHANVGGFDGNFTTNSNMRVLRQELLRSGKLAAGDKIIDILILDIVRQDI